MNESPIANASDSWFAIRVRSRCEKVAAADLGMKGFTVIPATVPHRRVWVDRVRVVEMPLFPGYIFGRFNTSVRSAIQRGAGVVGIVGAGGIDIPVPETEMDSILGLLRSGAEVFTSPFLYVGAKVRVCRGPLTGVVGVLQQVKNGFRLVISVEFLHRAVAVEVDSATVVPLPQGPSRVNPSERLIAAAAG
jgi:transcription termination/antitermination protein NusG